MKREHPSYRIIWISVALAAVFTVFSFRLIILQVARHAEYAQIAAERNTIKKIIPARRGVIRDRHGVALADNLPMQTVIVDGSHVNNAKALAELAAPYLQMDEKELLTKLTTDRKYAVVKHKVPESDAFALGRAMQGKHLRGLYFDPDTQRVYLNNTMLCHLIGFLDHEGKGIQGIEMTMDAWLRGEDGFRFIERDRTGQEIVLYRGQEQPPRNGNDVYLTIDMGLQAIVEEAMDEAYESLDPDMAVAVMVDPKTGEVLAMVNRPDFDPNRIGDAQPEQMKNRAVIDMVEPGSIFKIVVAAAGIDKGVASPATQIFCENGRFSYGGRILKDHHGYGMLGVHDILMKSSNIGSAKLALMMGGESYYEYVRHFGFGEKTGIDLPGEIRGLVHSPHQWDKLTITRMPMGHSVATTPIQLTMAMSVIANGGKLMRPHVVKKIQDAEGNIVKDYTPEVVRQVIRSETASFVNHALMDVVSKQGTAPLAAVNGYHAAGKTGTAQKINPKGGYLEGKYVVSFLGYLPAEDPRFVLLVMVDNAKKLTVPNYGGLVSAPIFSKIAEKVASYLDIPRSADQNEIFALQQMSQKGEAHANR